ncbi:MAG TPA: hypothetical protein VGX94_09000 [Terriglobia bacterium]|nr:hypothetical protein [Terriglobia bacterium]
MSNEKSVNSSAAQSATQAGQPPASAAREDDAIYQKDRLVARVSEPEIDLSAGQIRFAEIYNSDELILADECEFRQHRILVRKIVYATKVERSAAHKGRILQGVTAQIIS